MYAGDQDVHAGAQKGLQCTPYVYSLSLTHEKTYSDASDGLRGPKKALAHTQNPINGPSHLCKAALFNSDTGALALVFNPLLKPPL